MSRALIRELDKDVNAKAPELAKKLNLLHAINFLVEAWNGVTENTLKNCWRKSGLVSGPERNEEVEIIDPNILQRLALSRNKGSLSGTSKILTRASHPKYSRESGIGKGGILYSLRVTIGYSDTFPLSRQCHCKRGSLYL